MLMNKVEIRKTHNLKAIVDMIYQLTTNVKKTHNIEFNNYYSYWLNRAQYSFSIVHVYTIIRGHTLSKLSERT